MGVSSLEVRIENVNIDIFKVKTAVPNRFQQYFFLLYNLLYR